MRALTSLFSFRGQISRRAYVTIGLSGAIVKHLIDIYVASKFGRDWNFFINWDVTSYFMPVGVPTSITHASIANLAIVLAVAAPFAWIGLAITVKRFRTIGWPAWLVVLFFVPVANIASFAVAAAWPERLDPQPDQSPSRLARFVPSDTLGAAIFAMVLTAALGLVLVGLATRFFVTYGWGLFAALPFIQGALAAYLYGLNGPRTSGATGSVAMCSIAITALALLALEMEGAICIIMAAPIAFAFGAIGAVFGYAVSRRSMRVNVGMLITCVVLAPAVMGVETLPNREAPTYHVTTFVDIDAPPNVVWQNVIRFPDLPAPTELPFRVGIAYPMRAKIVGSGVGAIRYCEFSTGDFVEPITIWQPDHKLAFSVTKSAEPMREWSPYGHIDAPHLHGYMVSRHGEFALAALPDGRTRLTGTTWYQHHLWPAAYWAIWSDEIVHDIHLRVLKHIKTISEKHTKTLRA